MIILENISSGEVHQGEELEFFIDDDTQIGEVYLDGDLIFQNLDSMNETQLERALNIEYKVLSEEADIYSDFIT
jgi:hypothetical protein